MTDPSCFLADLPYVSFLKHLVLICFLLKVKMKINGCVQNCHPNQRPPLDFFFSRAYSDISRSFDCCQKAPINEKPGKYPSYVVRRPLKVVLQQILGIFQASEGNILSCLKNISARHLYCRSNTAQPENASLSPSGDQATSSGLAALYGSYSKPEVGD